MNENKSLADLSVEEVLEMVESGVCTPAEALELEKQGKNRKTLVNALEKMVGTADTQENGVESQKTMVTLIKNIKHHNKRYKIGEQIEIEEMDFDSFVKAGIIKG